MNEFKNIEKELKRQADELLPSDELKETLKSRLYQNADKQVRSEEKRRAGRSVRPRRLPAKRIYAAVAACLVICIGLSLGLGLGLGLQGGGTPPTSGDTYVAIDINPSFGVTATADGVVKEVTALNEDAALVVYGEDFSGRQVEDVCAELAELSLELGYLSKDGKVTVTACNDDEKLQLSVADKINQKITQNEVLSLKNVTVNLVSGGKSALLDAAGEHRSSLDASMTAAQINALIKDYDENKIKDYVASISAEYAAELEELRAAAVALVAAIEQYESNPNPTSAFNLLNIGLECINLYTSYCDVEINFMNLPEYVDGFYAFVEKVGSGEDAEIQGEVRDFLKLKLKESADA